MADLKTSADLLRALEDATRRELTSEEVNNQRVSFIFGSLKDDNNITKQRIREVLARNTGSLKR